MPTTYGKLDVDNKNELLCSNGFFMSGSKPRWMQTNDWREGGWLCKAPVSLTLIPSPPQSVRFYSTQHETGPNNNLFLWAWWLWNKSWNLGATAHLLSFLMGTPALPPKSVSCSQFSRWRGYSQRWRSQPNKQWVCACVSLTESPCGDRPKPDG